MPYIPVAQRQACDRLIDELAGQIVRLAEEGGSDGAFAGLLNYACTRLALQIVRRRCGWPALLADCPADRRFQKYRR